MLGGDALRAGRSLLPNGVTFLGRQAAALCPQAGGLMGTSVGLILQPHVHICPPAGTQLLSDPPTQVPGRSSQWDGSPEAK